MNDFGILTSKFFIRFGPFFGQKIVIFAPKKVFGHLFSNCSSELHVNCSDSCWLLLGTIARRNCYSSIIRWDFCVFFLVLRHLYHFNKFIQHICVSLGVFFMNLRKHRSQGKEAVGRETWTWFRLQKLIQTWVITRLICHKVFQVARNF